MWRFGCVFFFLFSPPLSLYFCVYEWERDLCVCLRVCVFVCAWDIVWVLWLCVYFCVYLISYVRVCFLYVFKIVLFVCMFTVCVFVFVFKRFIEQNWRGNWFFMYLFIVIALFDRFSGFHIYLQVSSFLYYINQSLLHCWCFRRKCYPFSSWISLIYEYGYSIVALFLINIMKV